MCFTRSVHSYGYKVIKSILEIQILVVFDISLPNYQRSINMKEWFATAHIQHAWYKTPESRNTVNVLTSRTDAYFAIKMESSIVVAKVYNSLCFRINHYQHALARLQCKSLLTDRSLPDS